MSAFLSPLFGAGAQIFNDQGIVLSGGKIYTYLAGSTTPAATWTTSTQAVQNANPIILSSAGRLTNEIWLQAAVNYKFVLTDSAGTAISNGTWDNISGVNDTTTSQSEWVTAALTPTFVSTSSFSVSGNATGTYTPNRRVQTVNTGGTYYGYVYSSTFGGGITTVVVVLDSGVLDSGISAANVGLLNATNPSIPQQVPQENAPVTVTAAATTVIGATTSDNVTVSGNTSITAFDTISNGIRKVVTFTGTPLLTYNVTSMILPGGVSIQVAAGDTTEFMSKGSGNWQCIWYNRANGQPLAGTAIPLIMMSDNFGGL
jgi:hypothetical protein